MSFLLSHTQTPGIRNGAKNFAHNPNLFHYLATRFYPHRVKIATIAASFVHTRKLDFGSSNGQYC